MKKKKGLHDEIARVAYEFYETRDRADGYDLDDWVAAEKIVMEKHERHAKETGQEVGYYQERRERLSEDCEKKRPWV